MTDKDIYHPGQYRIQLVATNYRKIGHEYIASRSLAIKRRETLLKHGYRVLLYLIDKQGKLRPVSC